MGDGSRNAYRSDYCGSSCNRQGRGDRDRSRRSDRLLRDYVAVALGVKLEAYGALDYIAATTTYADVAIVGAYAGIVIADYVAVV